MTVPDKADGANNLYAMLEQWKPVEENPNYEVSSCGKVKRNGKLIKVNVNKRGYQYCNISTNGKVTKVKIHRLVAKAFVSNPLNCKTVNHKDGNKLNNHFTNLEWVSLRQNIQHGWEIGLYKPHNPYKLK